MTVRMDIESIIRTDMQTHYKTSPVEEGLKNYYEFLADGYWAWKYDKTVFVTKKNRDVVEYHSVNAGTMKDYVSAFYKFIDDLRGAKKAITTLNNPRLAAVIKRYFKEITIIHDGFAITDLGKARDGLGRRPV